jgi:hypothetical protein
MSAPTESPENQPSPSLLFGLTKLVLLGLLCGAMAWGVSRAIFWLLGITF